jgi:hypothetical protein
MEGFTMAENLILFKVQRLHDEDDTGKNMALLICKDGTYQLGTYRKKNKSFSPVGQYVFKDDDEAIDWAQNAWECGEKFD